MSRSLGWTLLTTRSPIEIVPEVMFSSPASIRSKVDLPQPEGPTSTTNSPSSIGTVTPCRTSKAPKDFRTSRILTDDIQFPPASQNDAPQSGLAAGSCLLDRLISDFFGHVLRSNPWIKVVSLAPGGRICDVVSSGKRRPTPSKNAQ